MKRRERTEEERRAEEVLKRKIVELLEGDVQAIAEELAQTDDGDLFGAGEFRLRDRLHRMGKRALEVALEAGEKKPTIRAPA